MHRRHGGPDPALSEGLRQVRRGLRRLIGAAPRRQARPLQTDDIRTIVTASDRTTPVGVGDAAIGLLGFACALRRSELDAFTVGDVEHKPGGLIVTVTRSKSNQHGEGERVAVVHGQHASTDQVWALNAWLDLRGRASGPPRPIPRGHLESRPRTLTSTRSAYLAEGPAPRAQKDIGQPHLPGCSGYSAAAEATIGESLVHVGGKRHGNRDAPSPSCGGPPPAKLRPERTGGRPPVPGRRGSWG